MKLIIIKDCKDGKVNDIIEVKDGYGKNFLIRNKFAISYNKNNLAKLQKELDNKKNLAEVEKVKALKIKEKLESLNLKFAVKTTKDVIHGFITRKQIHKQLEKIGIHIDNRLIENVKINTLGNSFVFVNLFANVKAKLKIEVISEK